MEERTGFTYETVRAGQPRAYADSVYEYRITIVAMPYADNQDGVKTIAHLLRGRGPDGIADSSEKAGFCQPYFTKIEKANDVWTVVITEPFTDWKEQRVCL